AGRLDAARGDAVHADPQRAQLHRQLLAEHPERRVAGAARRVQGNGLLRGAGDVDDAAAPTPLHVRDDGFRAANVAEELAVDRIDEGVVRQIDERPEGGGAGVVDQDVDATQSVGGLRDHALTAGEAAQVA